MSELLNAAQRNSLVIGLRAFEKHLRQADAWLQGYEERGILYRRRLDLTPERRAAARSQIAAALQHIAALADRFDLPMAEESYAATMAGQMTADWADLCDLRSTKLQRYGDVHPGLAALLDADLDALAQQALALAAIDLDRATH